MWNGPKMEKPLPLPSCSSVLSWKLGVQVSASRNHGKLWIFIDSGYLLKNRFLAFVQLKDKALGELPQYLTSPPSSFFDNNASGDRGLGLRITLVKLHIFRVRNGTHL